MSGSPLADELKKVHANLASALTFHASFDHGPDADFALGDKQSYTAVLADGKVAGVLTPGIADPSFSIAKGAGKFGDALVFTQASDAILLYKAEKNVAYTPREFRGSVSLWMRLDPAEIPGQYTDPLQITDKDYSDDCIWIDFTKNDTPSDFRLGIFGNRSQWDVQNLQSRSQQFYWRLAKVAEPPFAKDRWTHIVVTWDGINSSKLGRARLYFDAQYQGATGAVGEQFQWDVANAAIRLGTGPFVGLIDELAFFNKPLTPAEIEVLHRLDRGVSELYA